LPVRFARAPEGPADVGNVSTIHAALAYQMAKDVYIGLVRKTTDAIALIAGDAEYAPLVADLVREGSRVDVHFWADHADAALKEAASTFVALDLKRTCLHAGWSATPSRARRPVRFGGATVPGPIADAA
jgi:hypothetical protein